MSDVWIHTRVEIPLNDTWITWTLTNRNTEEQIDTGKYDYSEKFDPDCRLVHEQFTVELRAVGVKLFAVKP